MKLAKVLSLEKMRFRMCFTSGVWWQKGMLPLSCANGRAGQKRGHGLLWQRVV